jgi:hypothetical protein
MKCRLALAVLLAASAWAQDRPTMEQTAKWLATKIAEGGGTQTLKVTGVMPDESTTSSAYRDVAIQDCKLTFTSIGHTLSTRSGPSHSKSVVTVPLAKVKEDDITVVHVQPVATVGPLEVRGERWNVNIGTPVIDIVTTNTKEAVGGSDEVTVYHNLHDVIEFGNSPSIDEDTANRVQKALKYAVSLCRDAAKQVKEPF